ncbi:hypothetical protein JR316_0003062 [Psilocybe cubensis]|uniref:Uncharacterized protein n=1 Tax=Psilocybe cubensis TaxID=181762 RepID=A0ACB8H7D8_PSICU|nr:hypothetical protein JR316_0003062 [Psilocybe cubensis]KAH9483592.1 hypothetical protein JR316_0003062 [Psilocybe cubensis]
MSPFTLSSKRQINQQAPSVALNTHHCTDLRSGFGVRWIQLGDRGGRRIHFQVILLLLTIVYRVDTVLYLSRNLPINPTRCQSSWRMGREDVLSSEKRSE